MSSANPAQGYEIPFKPSSWHAIPEYRPAGLLWDAKPLVLCHISGRHHRYSAPALLVLTQRFLLPIGAVDPVEPFAVLIGVDWTGNGLRAWRENDVREHACGSSQSLPLGDSIRPALLQRVGRFRHLFSLALIGQTLAQHSVAAQWRQPTNQTRRPAESGLGVARLMRYFAPAGSPAGVSSAAMLIRSLLLIATLSLALPTAAVADRFSDADYECEQANAKPELGFRCLVARQDGPTYLYVYELPVELDTASAKRRNYQRNQIQKGFLASGGIFVSQFWRKDGKLMSRACSRGKGKPASAGVWCGERFEVTEAQMNPIKARLTQ